MGFSLQDIRDAAEKKFQGLVIDDAPGGPLTLRSAVRLNDAESAAVAEIDEKLKALEGSDDQTNGSVRKLLVENLKVLADRAEAVEELLKDEDLAFILALYEAYGEQVKNVEGK